MEDKNALKDFSIILTAGIFFTYIIGYLVVTGYLSNYEVINDDLLNLNFLKAGLVYLIILIPPLLIIHPSIYNYTELREFNSKRIILLLLNLFILLILFVFLSMVIERTALNLKLLFYIIALILIICIVYFLVFKALSWAETKEFNFIHLTAHLIWICLLSYIFGSHLYGDLPKSFKGGFPDSTYILCKKETINYLNNIGFDFDSTNFSDKVVIFYSSNDKLLIKEKNEYYFLSKELFNGFKTLNGNK